MFQAVPERENQTVQKLISQSCGEFGVLGKPRVPNSVLIAIGGWSESMPTAEIETLDLRFSKRSRKFSLKNGVIV
jgi:hypothetical protein